jgi:hypothetical protein
MTTDQFALLVSTYLTSNNHKVITMRLKRWESPRKEGRNNKGRGGSARQRQLKKRQQMLRKRLKDDSNRDNQGSSNDNKRGEKIHSSPCFLAMY